MNIKSIFNNSSKILIYIFIVVTSYAKLFSLSIWDDIIILVIGFMQILWLVIKRNEIRRNTAIIILLFAIQVVYFITNIILIGNSYTVESFLTYTKIIIALFQPILFDYKSEEKYVLLRNIFYISIPNLLYNAYEFIKTYIQHEYIGGKYDANGMYRLEGLSGHPIFYSLLLVVLLLFSLYHCKSKLRYVYASVCFVICMLTWSSLAQVAALLLVAYKLIDYTKVKGIFKRYVCLLAAGLITALTVFIFLSMIKETYTIRYISVVETINNIKLQNILQGSGFGTFAENGLSESYVFHIIYENGLMGILLVTIILAILYKIQFKKKNYTGLFILSLYLMNMVINEGYMIPFIIFITVLCGQNIEAPHIDNQEYLKYEELV